MKSLVLACFVVGAVALLMGCGGGGGGGGAGQLAGRLDSNSPRTDDGSAYQEFDLTAVATANVEITATSSAFDVFLIVERIDADGGGEVLAEDDDSGDGTNAALTISVTEGSQYKVIVTGVEIDAVGAFSIDYPTEVLR